MDRGYLLILIEERKYTLLLHWFWSFTVKLVQTAYPNEKAKVVPCEKQKSGRLCSKGIYCKLNKTNQTIYCRNISSIVYLWATFALSCTTWLFLLHHTFLEMDNICRIILKVCLINAETCQVQDSFLGKYVCVSILYG